MWLKLSLHESAFIIYQDLFKASNYGRKDKKTKSSINPIFKRSLTWGLVLTVPHSQNEFSVLWTSVIDAATTHTSLPVCLGLETYKTIPDRSYSLVSGITYSDHKGFLCSCWHLRVYCTAADFSRCSLSAPVALCQLLSPFSTKHSWEIFLQIALADQAAVAPCTVVQEQST